MRATGLKPVTSNRDSTAGSSVNRFVNRTRRDSTGRGETEPTERDGICPARRGHHTRERQPETVETDVVWLITQRSRVQIPPPLPSPEALSRTEKGPSACGLLTGRGRSSARLRCLAST